MEHETTTTMFTILYKAFSCSKVKQIFFYVPPSHTIFTEMEHETTTTMFTTFYKDFSCSIMEQICFYVPKKHSIFTEMKHETGTTMFTTLYKAFSCSKVEQICCFFARNTLVSSSIIKAYHHSPNSVFLRYASRPKSDHGLTGRNAFFDGRMPDRTGLPDRSRDVRCRRRPFYFLSPVCNVFPVIFEQCAVYFRTHFVALRNRE